MMVKPVSDILKVAQVLKTCACFEDQRRRRTCAREFLDAEGLRTVGLFRLCSAAQPEEMRAAIVWLAAASGVLGFSGNELRSYVQPRMRCSVRPVHRLAPGRSSVAMAADEPSSEQALSAAEIGNLVADDEYLGLTMELTELVRIAIREEMKAKLRDFIGADDYKVGDISKELDGRIKSEVARLRGKETYELGDLSVALDTFAKEEVTRLTGKDGYEFGDLSVEIDKRVKEAVGKFTGKGTYTPGDLQAEIRRRVAQRVVEVCCCPRSAACRLCSWLLLPTCVHGLRLTSLRRPDASAIAPTFGSSLSL